MNRGLESREKPESAGQVTERRIAQAAAAVFCRSGYKGASIEAIATAAQVNKSLIYYYFKNKKGLYRSVMRSALVSITDVVDQEVSRSSSLIEKVVDIFSRNFDLFLDNRETIELFFKDISYGTNVVRELIETEPGLIMPHLDNITYFIRQGIETGLFRPVEPEKTVFTIFNMLAANITSRQMFDFVSSGETGEKFDDEAWKLHLLDMILTHLLAPEARRSAECVFSEMKAAGKLKAVSGGGRREDGL